MPQTINAAGYYDVKVNGTTQMHITPSGADFTGYVSGLEKTSTQTGTTYTLALSDKGSTIFFTATGPGTITVPPNSDVAFPIGTKIRLIRTAGSLFFQLAAGDGVTLTSKGGAVGIAAGTAFEVVKQDTDTWFVFPLHDDIIGEEDASTAGNFSADKVITIAVGASTFYIPAMTSTW